jgi:hypothetical protein
LSNLGTLKSGPPNLNSATTNESSSSLAIKGRQSPAFALSILHAAVPRYEPHASRSARLRGGVPAPLLSPCPATRHPCLHDIRNAAALALDDTTRCSNGGPDAQAHHQMLLGPSVHATILDAIPPIRTVLNDMLTLHGGCSNGIWDGNLSRMCRASPGPHGLRSRDTSGHQACISGRPLDLSASLAVLLSFFRILMIEPASL